MWEVMTDMFDWIFPNNKVAPSPQNVEDLAETLLVDADKFTAQYDKSRDNAVISEDRRLAIAHRVNQIKKQLGNAIVDLRVRRQKLSLLQSRVEASFFRVVTMSTELTRQQDVFLGELSTSRQSLQENFNTIVIQLELLAIYFAFLRTYEESDDSNLTQTDAVTTEMKLDEIQMVLRSIFKGR